MRVCIRHQRQAADPFVRLDISYVAHPYLVRPGRELPSYDEYLIGYKSRHHAIAEQFCRQAYNKNGIFYPVIVQNGEVIGNWLPNKKATFFEDGNKVDISSLLRDFHQWMSI